MQGVSKDQFHSIDDLNTSNQRSLNSIQNQIEKDIEENQRKFMELQEKLNNLKNRDVMYLQGSDVKGRNSQVLDQQAQSVDRRSIKISEGSIDLGT